jgi:predicted esterase
MLSGNRLLFCAALAVLLVLPNAPSQAADSYYFDIDPTLSEVQIFASVNFQSLGVQVPMVGQATHGLGVPFFGDGTTTRLDGVMAAQIDWSAGTASFGGGSLYGMASGLWEPAFQGADGLEPAVLGAMITDLGGIPAVAVAAVRNFWVDYSNAYSVTSLIPNGLAGYEFATDHWLSVSSQVDLRGKTGLAAFIEPGRTALAEAYAAQNVGGTGNLQMLGLDSWEIQIPLNTNVLIEAGELEGLGSIFVDLQVVGNIVGRSTTVPVPAAIFSNGDNDSLLTAQSLDGAFRREYSPEVGDEVLNVSAAIPHATVVALGDGSFDYYQFTVAAAGTLGYFDIDGATFDSELLLFDEDGGLLARNDDAPSNAGALGSDSSLDAFLSYTFLTPGTYKLAVAQYQTLYLPPLLFGNGPPPGSEYRLHVSLTTAVPEPSTWCLGLLGAVGLIAARRRRCRHLVTGLALLALSCAAAAPAQAASPLIKTSIEEVFDRDGTYPMGYRLFVPPTLEPEDSVPLVLFLHGAGEQGTDNYYQVANHIDGLISATQGNQFRSILLAPQVTDFPFAGGWDPNSPFDRTMEILQSVMQQYPVDPSRIYITGLSMGGYGTWDYIAEFPDFFAAAAPLAGGGSTASANAIKDVPIWAFHGALDDVVSVNQSRRMINAIVQAGGSPLYTEIPNGRHDIWPAVYGNQFGLYEWMFAQQNLTPSPLLTVPEPSGWALACMSLALLGWVKRKRFTLSGSAAIDQLPAALPADRSASQSAGRNRLQSSARSTGDGCSR